MGFVVSFFSLLMLYIVVFLALYFSGVFKIKLKIWEVVIACLLYVAFMMVVYWLVKSEKTIHYWDSASYWYKTLEINKGLSYNWRPTVEGVYSSVNNASYNSLLAFMIAFPMKILGASYTDFVFCTLIFFLIPSMIVSSLTFVKITKMYEYKQIPFYIVTLICILFPMYTRPLYSGIIDSAGLLVCATSFFVIVDRKFDKLCIKRDVILGLLLVYIIILRRYFSLWVVGFVVFLFLYWCINNLGDKKALKNAIISYAITGITSVAVMFIFFNDLVVKNMSNNYGTAYAAYNNISLIGKWTNLAYSVGILFVLLIFAGVILDFRKSSKNKTAIWLLINVIITGSVFFSMQDMATHHQYTVAFQFLALIFIGFLHLVNIFDKKLLKIGATTLVVIAVAINFLYSISAIQFDSKKLLTRNIYKPEMRTDLDEFERLDGYLQNMHEKGITGVYVLGTHNINDDMLRKLYAPYMVKGYELLPVSQIDLRDGFSMSFFDANIIVVEDYVPCEDVDGFYKVITWLKQEFLENDLTMISDNFYLDNTFEMKNNTAVYVYIKQNDFDREDISYLMKKYKKAYSEEDELFENRFLGKLKTFHD